MARTTPNLSIQAAPRASLAVTPQMKLALELLALPAVELARRLEAEVIANPALEIDGEEAGGGGAASREAAEAAPGASSANPAAPGAAETREGREPTLPGLPASAAPPTRPEPAAWPFEREAGESREETGSSRGADRFEAPGPVSLGEHLRAQLVGCRLGPDVRHAIEYLIGSLDDRGRLLISVPEAARDLGIPVERVAAAAAALRGLDPPGIGARDLRECLLLQLRARDRVGSVAWRLVDEAFDLLGARRCSEAARRLGVPATVLAEGREEIRRLLPHPGRLFAADPVRYIVPDLWVRRIGSELVVGLEDRIQPRLRIGRVWTDLAMARTGADAEVREFAARRHRAARRLIRAVDRRRETLVRVVECIVLEQGAFFDRGTACLRPMRLKTVAARLGLHESTVARVVRGKSVETPLGLFPLRHFFSGGLDRSGRPGTAARAVRERIRDWIESEDPARPLTDDGLVARLEEEGLLIARRTVAKYRSSLGIEPARRRRLRTGREPRGRGTEARSACPNPLCRR